MPSARITKLFIANRGEIARRIGQTCRKLGIKAVAVKHSPEIPGYLRPWIDEFVDLPDLGVRTYLDSGLMIKAAKLAGADGLHPGFGFLSENAGFARNVIDAGLVWVGPTPESIEVMAGKDDARALAMAHEVPCVPGLADIGTENLKESVRQVADFGKQVGYPLLIKAALGGGGKGMRVVHGAHEIEDNLARAASEALNSFASGKLIVEKYLEHPRHVEIQVFADTHGNTVTLMERDCSVQRRHQKIIEEAPSVGLHPETRAGLHEAALRVARAARYTNAGTVEFLVDWSKPHGVQPYYFLEMNTRLQVEHPVTEEILGLDLVEWQLRVAQGEPLPPKFARLESRGHSIEARLYAEDPLNKFLPAPGRVEAFVPFEAPHIRWEIGLDPIDEISAHYDPMIAKVIATGESRAEALYHLREALSKSLILGPTNNQSYLLAILSHPEFSGAIPTTRFITDYQASLEAWLAEQKSRLEPALSSLAPKVYHELNKPEPSEASAYFSRIFAQSESVKLRTLGSYTATSGSLASVHGDVSNVLWCWHRNANEYKLYLQQEGARYCVKVDRHEGYLGAQSGATGHEVKAPVPGKIIRVMAEGGGKFEQNQTLIVLESMKMEFEVKAGKVGIIEEICVRVGDQVSADQILAVWRK